jgi:hypothetical protein
VAFRSPPTVFLGILVGCMCAPAVGLFVEALCATERSLRLEIGMLKLPQVVVNPINAPVPLRTYGDRNSLQVPSSGQKREARVTFPKMIGGLYINHCNLTKLADTVPDLKSPADQNYRIFRMLMQ